jgi:hypothetical protein
MMASLKFGKWVKKIFVFFDKCLAGIPFFHHLTDANGEL